MAAGQGDEKRVDFGVGVVLPAAGCGERMKLPVPKQFCEVFGRPLICYTIECFHRHAWIRQIVVATSKEHVDLLRDIVDKAGFSRVMVVEGGATRHRSIHAALKTLQQVCADIDVVMIHDAVRPFVSGDMLKKMVWTARSHGAAGVCRPLVSTVIARDEQHVMTESLDRRRFVASEMPQAFQTSVISAAYDQCTIEDFEHGTECLLLAMKYVGVRATVLDGNPDLWKVTYKKDLLAAEGVIKERLMRIKVIGADRQEDVAGAIRTALQGHQLQLADGPVGNHTLPQPSSFGDLTSPTAPAVNTFILLHADLTRVDSAEKLSAVQREHLPVAPRPQLIDFTFLHIFLMTDEADITEKQAALLKVVMQLASEGRTKNQQIFGILAVMDQAPDRLGKMAASVLLRGHADFSGQIFLVL
ncbi:hypothetical protein BaRGS_00029937 [Batillaria attramentaria]|uniref:2-C-methyl-D-erythritol 4-phosphate cytidylyltransferase, chloroplastic n=1 Tax=Batillaria attramentaria TaxID=370345 RepID=A0ABD0JVE9_9CAEN